MDDLVERLETCYDNVQILDQKSVKGHLVLLDMQSEFPMICNEYTPDSNFEVTIEESKFLNDRTYNGTWIIGGSDDFIDFILCIKTYEQRLFIDALEVNESMRCQGIGANVIAIIESVTEQYYDSISVSPFDTDAINFWEHMEYSPERNGNWIKELKREGC